METQNKALITDNTIYLDLVPKDGEIVGIVYGFDECGRLPIAIAYAHHQEEFYGKGLKFIPVERVDWNEIGLDRLRSVWDLFDEHIGRLYSFLIQTVWENSGEYPRVLGGEIRQEQNRFEFKVTKRGHYEYDEVVEDTPKTEDKEEDCSSFVIWTTALALLAEVGVLIGLVVLYIRAFL